MPRDEHWIPVTGAKLPVSRSTLYRLARDGLVMLKRQQFGIMKAQERVCVMEEQVNEILEFLRGKR